MSCPKNTTPQDVNLDCFVQPEELEPFTKDLSLPESVRAYAQEKKKAMEARLAGNIETALQHESTCNSLYQEIPENYQW